MNPRVTKLLEIDPPFLLIEFANGEVRRFDCEPFLDIGVFRELKDEPYFRKALVSGGTIAWPHEQDFCPDTLYLDSLPAEPINTPECHPATLHSN